MGGSRCTYRNCTVKTDGVVHMFHYPVYDKIRCHQWLVNAQRFEFLNLKLSQVRNRVICQYHFKDECFMNYKKEKLTFGAIPTIDGPHCETHEEESLPHEQIAKAISFVLNDAEESYKYSKKDLKAYSSIIYADFLTNGDAWEKQSLNETIWNNMVITAKEKKPRKKEKNTISWPDKGQDKIENQKSMITLSDLIDTSDTKITEFENPLLANINFNQNKEYDVYSNAKVREVKSLVKNDRSSKANSVKPEFSTFLADEKPQNVVISKKYDVALPGPDLNNLIVNEENNTIVNMSNANTIVETNSGIMPVDQDIQTLLNIQNQNHNQCIETPLQLITTPNDYCAIIENPNELLLGINPNVQMPNEEISNFITIDEWKAKKTKITILSEKTISDPVLVKGHLEPVSPSTFITIPKKVRDAKPVTELEIANNVTGCAEIKLNENIPPTPNVIERPNKKHSTVNKRISKSNDVGAKPLLVKHKIAPERVAAIEKKRNFNKKLRDIIEICLEKLYDQDKTNDDSKFIDPTKVNDSKENPCRSSDLDQNIGKYLSQQPELPNAQEYMMNHLEVKLKRMENLLLGKIEQNSQRIVELKNVVAKSPKSNKTAGTQTPHNEESYKKQLYQEISKFLSPNASSLVYEELFIDKYGQKLTNPSPKRRKRR